MEREVERGRGRVGERERRSRRERGRVGERERDGERGRERERESGGERDAPHLVNRRAVRLIPDSHAEIGCGRWEKEKQRCPHAGTQEPRLKHLCAGASGRRSLLVFPAVSTNHTG